MNFLHLYTKISKLPKPLLLTRHSINAIKQIGIVTGISTLSLLGAIDLARADKVNLLNSTTTTATGAGTAGIPSITNFNIPAGRNRVILVIPMFERDHCLVASNCVLGNTAGTGLGSNYASPNLTGLNATTATPQLTARFVGAGGTVDKKNALTTTGTPAGDLRFINQFWSPDAPNNQYSKGFFSEESYHIAIFESEIQTLLGGASSGSISLSLPDIVAPKNPGDDAIFMVFVFEGVTQTNVGIVRSGVDLTLPTLASPAAGNFTRSISAFDAGQAPTVADDGVLALGVSTVGAPTNNGGYNQMTGFTIAQNAFTTNSSGIFDATNQPSTNTTEPSGFSATAQFRNGVPSLPLTFQSSAPSSISTMGGMAAVFTLLSAPPAPDLTLTKSDGGVSFTQGSNGTYTLTPRNNGTAATTGTITIVDTLPAELTYVSATGTGWSCSYAAATRKVTCTSTTAIAANATGNPITLTVTASSGAGTTITNSATISGGGEGALDATNNTVSDTTPIISATLKDYGDAPATYGSPSHAIVTGLNIGSAAPDAETAPVAPLDGTGDGADEIGLVLPTLSVGATSYQVPNISVTNSTGSAAKLVGWIDFNNNGVFDSNEAATVDVPNSGTQTVTLNWSGLSGVTAGNTYARFRLTSDATVATGTASTSSPTIAASNGEVEDYALAIAASKANVLMVKRITAINGDSTKNPNDNTPLNTFVDDTTSSKKNDDNSPNWPTGNYLKGAIDAGKVKPGDEIEYTVYFLNAGGSKASSVRLCDEILPNQTFKVGAYGANQDVQLGLGANALQYLTSANDALDRTQLYAPGATVPTNCYIKGTNADGTLQIDVTGASGSGNPAITAVPGATAPGAPNDSYGFFRFVTKVKP